MKVIFISILLAAAYVQTVIAQDTNAMSSADATSLDGIEERVVELINDHRRAKEKGPLQLDERISVVCRKYSEQKAADKKRNLDAISAFAKRFEETKVAHADAFE